MCSSGDGLPMEPGRGSIHGNVAKSTGPSVWPKPSRIFLPVRRSHASVTSALSGSPAVAKFSMELRS